MEIMFVDRQATTPASLRIFEPKSRTIKDSLHAKLQVVHYTLIHFDGFVYALGGKDRSVHRLRYADEEATWERMADMIEEHGWLPHVTVVCGHIYVIGGQWLFTYCAVERYDPSTNKWERLEDKPETIHGSAVVTSGEYIYSFGGFIKGTYVKNTNRLDVVTSTWKEMTPMNEARGMLSAAERENLIYVAGGQVHKSFIATVERYDPSVDRWTTLSPMVIARSWFKLHLVDGALYAVGGRRSPAFCTIEEYDIDKNEWNVVLSDESIFIYESVPIS